MLHLEHTRIPELVVELQRVQAECRPGAIIGVLLGGVVAWSSALAPVRAS